MEQRSTRSAKRKPQNAGQQDIEQKIDELFAYRRLTNLFQQSGIEQDDPLVEHLQSLQYHIYRLDAYLESTWTLDDESQASLWSDIRQALMPFGIADEKEQKSILQEIVLYEHIEQNCRIGKWPTAVSFETFYRTKSCDVRLIRLLLYKAKPDLNDLFPLKAWSFYDLITEVNDDISDLYEDLPTWNANRFLISILRKGHVKTDLAYRSFLASIAYRTQQYFSKAYTKGEQTQLFEWTAERLLETNQLLRECMDSLDHARLTQSQLFGKME